MQEPILTMTDSQDDSSTNVLELCPECNQGELILRGRCKECILCGTRMCDLILK
jgi:hypothetical protein